ncbi:hypothetical protein H8B13_09050 [Hymenobacter sp. BT188]|uniref:hypothetical protein n=1 Tax=Hymenobacter sp. BT188 TaxID=2763504 RepID=UPI0016512D04|nr:hypothetical protein [Hymenobacter sp. BT188]MBC6606963.1 hypothetical protein [Hymenobacter sp. BT188]
MSKKNAAPDEQELANNTKDILGHCGVIIPISDTSGYISGHWQQVLNIVKKAASKAQFTCEIVSDNSFSNVMHANIIANIFNNDIVICDVSSFNSNVMLELGLRIASKKPIIIIYDEDGKYPFDMNQLFYERYDKGLRYYDTEDFIERLSKRITNTYHSTKPDSPIPYKPYLDYFSDIRIEASDITRETVGLKEAVELLTKEVASIRVSQDQNSRDQNTRSYIEQDVKQKILTSEILKNKVEYALTALRIKSVDEFKAHNATVISIVKENLKIEKYNFITDRLDAYIRHAAYEILEQ